MPALTELTGEKKRGDPARQTPEQMKAIARTLNALFGGTVRRRNRDGN